MAKKKTQKKKQKVTRITNRNMVSYILTMVLWTLRNNRGDPWGAKRIEKFVDELHEIYGFILQGEINILDIKKQLEKETGIDIELKGFNGEL